MTHPSMQTVTGSVLALLIGVGASGAVQADLADTKAELSGYIKLDTLISKYNGSTPSAGIAEEFFVPSTISTDRQEEGPTFNMHVRETRFRLKTTTPVDGHSVRTTLEVDFMVLKGGDERISNSYAPRVRHAFFAYDGLPGIAGFADNGELLVGQTWSTFYNVESLPELNDFVGPVGTIFDRQPMVRYTVGDRDAGIGQFSLALENPETTVTVNGDGDRETPNDHRMPEVAAMYRYGPISASAIVRELIYQGIKENGNRIKEKEIGAAFSLAGRIPVPLNELGNDLRFMANVGNGLGRYIGLNAFNDAYLKADETLGTSLQWGGFVAYRHFWAPGLRSTLSASIAGTSYDDPFPGRGSQAERYYSSHLNLMYSPVQAMSYGIEYIYGRRENVDGSDGMLNRILLSAKYGF